MPPAHRAGMGKVSEWPTGRRHDLQTDTGRSVVKTIRALGCFAAVLAVISHSSFAEGIDLDCEAFSKQLVNRLDTEGLLTQSEPDRQRAVAITRDLCSGTEVSAQQQHETGKQEALDSWFFEHQPDKAGNKRLKNLKR